MKQEGPLLHRVRVSLHGQLTEVKALLLYIGSGLEPEVEGSRGLLPYTAPYSLTHPQTGAHIPQLLPAPADRKGGSPHTHSKSLWPFHSQSFERTVTGGGVGSEEKNE